MNNLESLYKTYFHKKLVIDIETVSQQKTFNEIPDSIQKHWTNKAKNFNKTAFEQESEENLYFQKAGIYAEYGKIICISIGYFSLIEDKIKLNTKSYYNDNEQTILLEFLNDIKLFENKFGNIHFIGHNIKEFDLPYICRRLIINNLPLTHTLSSLSQVKSWNNPHVDTLELWRFGDYKHYITLDLLSNILDIPTSKDIMDGSMVNDFYWNQNRLTDIQQYCEKDIYTTACVYSKLSCGYIPITI